jgi:predicted ribosomally synthesized peptide with nif11-like leader
MSVQNEIERFARDVVKDTAFRDELKAFGADQEAVIAHANARGYNFAMNDLQAMVPPAELSDTQLEGVAGGVIFLFDNDVFLSGTRDGCFHVRRPGPGESIGTLCVW